MASKKQLLSFNADWSEDDRVLVSETLGLSEEQEMRLFIEHKPLLITAEDLELLTAAFEEASNADNEADEADEENEDNGDTKETEEKKPEPVTIEQATRFNRDAVDIAGTISEATCKEIETGWLSTEKAKIATLMVFRSVSEDAKKAGKPISTWPIPRSYREQGKVFVGTGDDKKEITFGANETPVWDQYTFMDLSEKTNNTVERKSSFYKVLFETTAIGKRLTALLDDYNTAIALHGKVPSFSKEIPERCRGFSVNGLTKRKKLQESRIRYGINRLIDAAKIDWQCRQFDRIPKHEGTPLYSFEMETVKGSDGKERQEYVNKNEPVQLEKFATRKVQGKEELYPTLVGNYSINAFLRFNVDEAISKAGGIDKVTMDHIIATVKRQKQKPPAQKAADLVKMEITNFDQLETTIYSQATFYKDYETQEAQAKMDAWLLKRMQAEDGAAFVEAFGDACLATDRVFNVISKKYNQIKADKLKTEQKKAAA